MKLSIVQINIRTEQDTVAARKLAQNVSDLAGLSAQSKTRFATAVSEVSRNALKYADGGLVTCNVIAEGRRQYVEFQVDDTGPGIEDLDDIMAGRYRSRSGMGLGLSGSKKLMDKFSVKSVLGEGTVVCLGMMIPEHHGRITEKVAEKWKSVLVADQHSSTVENTQTNTDALLRELKVLQHKEAELLEQVSSFERRNSDLRAAQISLKEQATVDELTGLMNRRSILKTLDTELLRAQRSGRPLTVVIADLDFFKRLNDTYGHLAGDAALKEAARRMSDVLRPYDSVGRYGGEEFLLVLPGCDITQATQISERVRSEVGDKAFEMEEATIPVTVSLGIVSSETICEAKALIDIADDMLYQAKEAGRNRALLATFEDIERVLETRATRTAGSPTEG